MENQEQGVRPAPFKEAEAKHERLVNEEMTGAQAKALFGDQLPPRDAHVDKASLQDILTATQPERSAKNIDASQSERDEYWKNKKTDEGKEMSKADQMKDWEDKLNGFLDGYAQTGSDEEKKFFESVGIHPGAADAAKKIYQTFIREQKSDPEYLAKLIAANNTEDQIEQHSELIKKIGNIYGSNQAKLTELLAGGHKNIETDEKAQAFHKSAHDNLTKATNNEILDARDSNASKWRTEHPAQPTPEPQPQPTQPTPDTTPAPEPQTRKETESGSFVRMGGESIPGSRGNNEDTIWFDEKIGAAVVCDGMGGGGDGDKAAQIVRDSMAESIKNMPTFTTSDEATSWLKEQMIKANETIKTAKEHKDDPISKDAATTLTAAFVWEGPNGERILINGNTGDSRISRVQNDNLHDITLDQAVHSFHLKPHPTIPGRFEIGEDGSPVIDYSKLRQYSEIKQLQEKYSSITDPETLRGEERMLWNMRNLILKPMDGEPLGVFASVQGHQVDPGDRIILRSDGLTDVMTNEQTLQVLRNNPDPQDAAKALNKKAQEADKSDRGKGYADDKSVIVMDIQSKPQTSKQPEPDTTPAAEGGGAKNEQTEEGEQQILFKNEAQQRLQPLLDKLKADYPGARGDRGWLGENISITEQDIAQVQKVINATDQELAHYPELQKLNDTVAHIQATFAGGKRWFTDVEANPQITEITTIYKGNVPALQVPPEVYALWKAQSGVKQTTNILQNYRDEFIDKKTMPQFHSWNSQGRYFAGHLEAAINILPENSTPEPAGESASERKDEKPAASSSETKDQNNEESTKNEEDSYEFYKKYLKETADLPLEEFKQKYTPEIEAQFKEYISKAIGELIKQKPDDPNIRYPDSPAGAMGLGGWGIMQRIIETKTGKRMNMNELSAVPFSEMIKNYLGMELPEKYSETFYHFNPNS
jgi:serine/threonine protein phosphatase PrpC